MTPTPPLRDPSPENGDTPPLLQRPEITVIVPVFNKAEYLEQALSSALSQSLHNLEVVVVDDGSEDDSLKVAHTIASADSRVRVIAQENAGVAAARNKGLEVARGAYVAFLDPDDWYPDDDALSDMLNAATLYGVPIAGGGAEKYVRGSRTRNHAPEETGYTFDTDGVREYADYQFDYGFWRFIYCRDFLVKNGLSFPPYRRYQDPPFFVRAMSTAGRFAALQRSTYVYRVAPGMNWHPSRVIDVMRGMLDVLRLAAEFDYHDLARRTIRRFNAPHIRDALDATLLKDDGRALPLLEALSQLARRYGPIGQRAAHDSQALSEPKADANGAIDVTVVVPVYNAAMWLHECLLSVLAQSRVTLEVICVNDGSTDDSMRIIREYQTLDPNRVRVIDQPNGGLSRARNSGIAEARGRYICFLDSDDYWRLDGLSTLVQRADEAKLDILQFDAVPFPDHGVSATDWERYAGYYARTTQFETGAGRDLMISQLADGDYKPSACLYLARSSFLKEIDLKFIPGMTHEDNPFTFAAILNASRAGHYSMGLLARRVRASSIMTSSSTEASMRGYFVGYLAMNREVMSRSFDPAQAQVLGDYLNRVLGNILTRFNKLDALGEERLLDLVTSPDAHIVYAMLQRSRKQTSKIVALKSQ